MLLNEKSLLFLFCPECSGGKTESPNRVWDNGWVLEMDMVHIRTHSPTFGISNAELTAAWVFDNGYVTWVGITPDDVVKRDRERKKIQHLAQTDMRAYIEAMKEWGVKREKKFMLEGWRKMQ